MPNLIDPTSPQNVLLGAGQPGPMDALMMALNVNPGRGWGGQELLYGLQNLQHEQEINRQKQAAFMAQQGLINPYGGMPQQITPERGLLGKLGVSLGLVPESRNLNPQEQQQYIFGQQQEQMRQAKMQQAQEMSLLRHLQGAHLFAQIQQMPEEEQRKLLTALMPVGREYGGEAFNQFAKSLGYTGPEVPTSGMGEAAKRAREPQAGGLTAGQQLKHESDVVKEQTSALRDTIKALTGQYRKEADPTKKDAMAQDLVDTYAQLQHADPKVIIPAWVRKESARLRTVQAQTATTAQQPSWFDRTFRHAAEPPPVEPAEDPFAPDQPTTSPDPSGGMIGYKPPTGYTVRIK